MPPPRGSWIWGTLAEREKGGFPLTLLADSVLPYSAPLEEAECPWWVEGQVGQFQGYERNLAEGGTGAPNYPTPRNLNAVLINMLGLKQSASAPFRLRFEVLAPTPEFPTGRVRLFPDNKDRLWPFGTVNPLDPEDPEPLPAVTALEVIEWYAEAYASGTVKFIVSIPERDFINFAGQMTPASSALPWSRVPDAETGEDAIAELIAGILLPPSLGGLGLNDRIVGWQLIDEPDLKNRRPWATPLALAKLRNLVRMTEMEIRSNDAVDPVFNALTFDEKKKALRPCLTTFSVDFFLNLNDPVNPQDYTLGFASEELGIEFGAADVFGFDWYPFRRTASQIIGDYPPLACSNPPSPINRDLLLVDPVRSIRAFRTLRNLLNVGKQPGTAGYFPVYLWQQTDGWPFRLSDSPISELLAPAILSNTDISTCKHAEFRRTKRYPSLSEQRFYNWAGLLELSEGTFGFGQTGAPDLRLREGFSKIAVETAYFGGLRHSARDLSSKIDRQELFYGFSFSDSRDSLPPAILYVEYTDQPSTPQGLDNRWLIIVNRHYSRLTGVITFSDTEFLGGFRLREFLYLASTGNSHIIDRSTAFTFKVDVPSYGVRIYQQRPR